MMTAGDAKRMLDAISAERFQPYLDACQGDQVRALRLYYWDGEVSRAFLSPLRDLEVPLRNSLHARLAGRYGQVDWWDSPRVRLNHKGSDQINAAKADLGREHGSAYSADDMVAKLTLGFWVGLLGRGTNYEFEFWRPALRHAFLGYQGSRGDLQLRFDYVRKLRNRIGHHERICHRRLDKDFDAVIALMRYVAPELAAMHERYSHVPTVLARRERVLSGEEPVCL